MTQDLPSNESAIIDLLAALGDKHHPVDVLDPELAARFDGLTWSDLAFIQGLKGKRNSTIDGRLRCAAWLGRLLSSPRKLKEVSSAAISAGFSSDAVLEVVNDHPGFERRRERGSTSSGATVWIGKEGTDWGSFWESPRDDYAPIASDQAKAIFADISFSILNRKAAPLTPEPDAESVTAESLIRKALTLGGGKAAASHLDELARSHGIGSKAFDAAVNTLGLCSYRIEGSWYLFVPKVEPSTVDTVEQAKNILADMFDAGMYASSEFVRRCQESEVSYRASVRARNLMGVAAVKRGREWFLVPPEIPA